MIMQVYTLQDSDLDTINSKPRNNKFQFIDDVQCQPNHPFASQSVQLDKTRIENWNEKHSKTPWIIMVITSWIGKVKFLRQLIMGVFLNYCF